MMPHFKSDPWEIGKPTLITPGMKMKILRKGGSNEPFLRQFSYTICHG